MPTIIIPGMQDPEPSLGTALPFDMNLDDCALIAKALRQYRPDTLEEEATANFLIDQFEKLLQP